MSLVNRVFITSAACHIALSDIRRSAMVDVMPDHKVRKADLAVRDLDRSLSGPEQPCSYIIHHTDTSVRQALPSSSG